MITSDRLREDWRRLKSEDCSCISVNQTQIANHETVCRFIFLPVLLSKKRICRSSCAVTVRGRVGWLTTLFICVEGELSMERKKKQCCITDKSSSNKVSRWKMWKSEKWVASSQENWDQYQYLGNCPPTPPLTQRQSINNKLRLMLG